MASKSVVLVAILCLLVAAEPISAATTTDFGSWVEWAKGLTASWSTPRTLCVPTASSYVEHHEGRHKCAYDHPRGFRAVGVGYNLDEHKERKQTELTTVLADYDKVYKGDQCLNDAQITALLAVDVKRKLDLAAELFDDFNGLCCEQQAVMADMVYAVGRKALDTDEFKDFVHNMDKQKWDKAAQKLRHTSWCLKNRNRCEDNASRIEKGCDSASIRMPFSI